MESPIQLLILRHAKSSWADEYSDDWERPLTERGVRNATTIGQLIRRNALVPDLIITSDAVRAQTTAQIVADAAGYTRRLMLSSSLYHARPAAVIEVLRSVSDDSARSVMIVGHNPGLEELIAQLTGKQIDLPTATLVNLAVEVKHWRDLDSSTRASLIDVWRPTDL